MVNFVHRVMVVLIKPYSYKHILFIRYRHSYRTIISGELQSLKNLSQQTLLTCEDIILFLVSHNVRIMTPAKNVIIC